MNLYSEKWCCVNWWLMFPFSFRSLLRCYSGIYPFIWTNVAYLHRCSVVFFFARDEGEGIFLWVIHLKMKIFENPSGWFWCTNLNIYFISRNLHFRINNIDRCTWFTLVLITSHIKQIIKQNSLSRIIYSNLLLLCGASMAWNDTT